MLSSQQTLTTVYLSALLSGIDETMNEIKQQTAFEANLPKVPSVPNTLDTVFSRRITKRLSTSLLAEVLEKEALPVQSTGTGAINVCTPFTERFFCLQT